MPVPGPSDPTNQTAMADFDVSIAETLFKQLTKTLPKAARGTQKKCEPAFVQLRFSGGEVHVDYVRLPLTQKGNDETSPTPKLTRSRPFVGLYNGVLNAAA